MLTDDEIDKLTKQHDRDTAELGRRDVELAQARREVERMQAMLARIEEWTHIFGAALKPRGADTYGDGMRDAKAQVSLIIRNDPHAVVRSAEVERIRPVYEAAKYVARLVEAIANGSQSRLALEAGTERLRMATEAAIAAEEQARKDPK